MFVGHSTNLSRHSIGFRFYAKSSRFSVLIVKTFQELVGGDDEKKDWWGISLSILTVILIGVLVGLSVVILTPAEIQYGPTLNFTESIQISELW